MKKSWIKWGSAIVAVLTLTVGVPVIINECYKSDNGYVTAWRAADVLAYYGTILGALVAVITIAVTIVFTRKQIQRESYLRTETAKWTRIEDVFAEALGEINPIRLLIETMDIGSTNPNGAIIIFQKYKMSCGTAADQLIAFLNQGDYPKVKTLLDQINKSTELFSEICDREITAYRRLQDLSNRSTAENALKTEALYPHSFPEDTLIFCRRTLENTAGMTLDTLTKDVAEINQEMIDAYEKMYRSLLQLKGQIFEAITTEIQQKADQIIYRWNHNDI